MMKFTSYAAWEDGVDEEYKKDAIWNMKVYRLALLTSDLAWHDASRLWQTKRLNALTDQLFRAVGSIGANIAEGYSRSSGKDQARFYEYALGSAREGREWYYRARHVLGETIYQHRKHILTQIIQHLLKIIPAQRGYKMKAREPLPEETYTLSQLLETIPLSEQETT